MSPPRTVRWVQGTYFLAFVALVAPEGCGADTGSRPANTGAAGTGGAGGGAAGTIGNAGTGAGPAGASGAAGAGDAGTTGGAGAGAGTSGLAGSTGAAGTTGNAGATGAAGTGGGMAGTGGGAAGTGAPSTMGVQMDPGTMGDGTFAQPGPYPLKPESTMLLNGAPKGQVLGPFIYTQKGTYTGWSMWKFTYYVYVPSQYKPGHAAAIMIFNDGLKYLPDPTVTAFKFNTTMVFDNLIHEGSMPVTIGVFIGPGSNDGHYVTGGDGGRARQYDTGNDQYGKFILDEFIPSEITSKYDIVKDADGWAMGGHSSGGIASIMLAWYYPDRLRKVLTASPSFPNTGGKFPNEFTKVTPAKPLRIYHLAGTQDEPGFRGANDSAAKIFMMMGYHYRYKQVEDVHAPPSAAANDFPDALRWLWRGYSAGR
jgi:enterochelin esterase family protein